MSDRHSEEVVRRVTAGPPPGPPTSAAQQHGDGKAPRGECDRQQHGRRPEQNPPAADVFPLRRRGEWDGRRDGSGLPGEEWGDTRRQRRLPSLPHSPPPPRQERLEE